MIKIIGEYIGKCRICYNEIIDIKYKNISTSNEIRSMGFESRHEYQYEVVCSNCGYDIKSEVIVFEYPTGFKNHVEPKCDNYGVVFDILKVDITKLQFEITDDIPVPFNKKEPENISEKSHCYMIVKYGDGDNGNIKLINTADIELNPSLIEGSVVIRVLSDNFEKSEAIFGNYNSLN